MRSPSRFGLALILSAAVAAVLPTLPVATAETPAKQAVVRVHGT